MTLSELNRKIELTEELQHDTELLESVKARAYSVSSPSLSGMPHGSDVVQKTEAFAVEIADLQARLEYLRNEISAQSKLIDDYCNSIENISLRLIFRYRFVHCMLWKEVAYMMGDGYTETSVQKAAYKFIEQQNREVEVEQFIPKWIG